MNCVNCSLDNLINYIVNKYNINRKTAIAVYYKLRNQVKNKLFCETDECNRKILKTFIKNNRFYKFFNNLSDCYLDLIIDNVLESCVIDITEPEPDPEPILGLRLTFLPGFLPPIDLASWNTVFDLPANGTAFTSITSAGDEVTLIGGAGITLRAGLFRTNDKLLKIEDDVDCVVAIAGGKGLGAVSLCSALTTVTLNGSITIGEEGLYSNASLTYLSATSCATMGKGACANNTILSTFSLPALTSAGESCFSQSPLMNFFDGVSSNVCPLLTTLGPTCFLSNTATPAFLFITATNIPSGLFAGCSCIVVSIPSCTTLGQTTGYNDVFLNCTNLTTVYCPTALATVDGGNPDGDLVYAVGTLGAAITYV
jgi:hypothetical protein